MNDKQCKRLRRLFRIKQIPKEYINLPQRSNSGVLYKDRFERRLSTENWVLYKLNKSLLSIRDLPGRYKLLQQLRSVVQKLP